MQLLPAFSSHSSGGHKRRDRMAGSSWWIHLIGAIALVAGLFLPLIGAGPAMAAPGDPAQTMVQRSQSASDTVPPAPSQVAAMGDFQSALGCADFDPYCQGTQLSEESGIWTGVFAVPPGQYSWQIAAVAPDGNVYTYGQGGLGGGAQQVSVAEGEAGIYFRLNTHTNEVDAEAVSGLLSVQVDGTSVALQPDNGQFSALVTSPGGGPANVQVFSGSEPISGPQQAQLNPGANRLIVSPVGQLVNVEPLASGSLTIERLDASGTPLPGGCYQLRSGGTLVNQGCDADDGADGYTYMSFPEGVPGGTVTVVEVIPPDGAEQIADQELQLEQGEMFVSLQPDAADEDTGEGDQTEDGQVIQADDGDDGAEPDEAAEATTGPPGDLIVNLFDQNGAPIPNACFSLLQDGEEVAESCDTEPYDTPDFAGNGTTGFFGEPSGTYTLRLTEAPGDVTAEDREVEILPGQQVTEDITVEAPPATEAPIETPTDVPTATPTEKPTEAPEPATFTVELLDQNGAPIGGACFQLVQNEAVAYESCDTSDWESAEFANNGLTGFFEVEPGTYTLRMVSGPEGVNVDDRQVEIDPGSDDTETITVETAQPTEETEPTATATEVPTEQATATEIATATEEATQPGDLIVSVTDADGQPVGEACFQLIQDGNVVQESCDTAQYEQSPGNGRIGFYGVPSGTYTLRNSANPNDLPLAEDREVEVVGGEQVQETVQLPAEATTPATETPTETPTPEPTATAVPAEEDAEPGNLTVRLEGQNGEPIGGACFALIDQNGAQVDESCDTPEQESAEFANNGNTGFFDVESGTYTLRMTSGPEGVDVEDREVEIEPEGDETVVVTADVAAPTAEPTAEPTAVPAQEEGTDAPEPGPPGDLIVTLQGENGEPIGGVCFQIEMAGVGPIERCDSDDPFPNNGNTGFFGVPSGTYTLTQTTVPEGTNPIDEREITIQPGSNPNLVVTPGEGDEGAGDDGAGTPDTGAGGTLQVDATALDEEDVCVELDTTGGIGFADPPAACDNESGDQDGGEGQIELPDVPPGQYIMQVTSGPEVIEERQVTVAEDEPTTVTLGQPEEPATGTLTIQVTDPENDPLGGACFDVSNTTGTFNFCDEDGDGTIEISDVAFGTQTITQTSAAAGYSPAPEQQVDVTSENPNVEVTVVNEPAVGTIRVVSEDAEGTDLGGACIAVDGGQEVCDQDSDGVVIFEEVPAGEHTVAQTVVPEGYEAAPEQTVTVEAGEEAEVRFTNSAETGAIHVVIEDAEGNRLPGSCVALDNESNELCDVDEVGEFTFTDVTVGEHTVIQTTPPTGYQTAENQTVTVEAGETAEVEFTNTPSTGNIYVSIEDTDGNQLPGACVTVDGGQELCDVDEDGELNFEQIPVGDHTLSQSTAPEGYQAAEDQTVTVEAGETAEVTFVNEVATGSIVATVQDGEGNPITGVCVGYAANGEALQTLCEPEDDGTYRFDNVEPGTYLVSVSQVPEDYVSPDPIEVEVVAGQDATAAFELAPAPPQTGNAILSLQTEDGQAAIGVCLQLTSQETGEQLGPFCDNGEGDGDATEGVILLEDIPVGVYEVTFTETGAATQGLQDNGDPITIEILQGETIEEVIVVPGLEVRGGIEMLTVDAATGEPVADACYTISTAEPTVVCDGGDGDESPDPGTVLVTGLSAGDYTVSMSTPPDGYSAAPDQTATVTGGATESLAFEVEAEVTPGSLTVNKVNEADEPLAGTCFRLMNEGGGVAQVCDAADGSDDGTITFTDVPAGSYELVETRTPGSEYQAAPNRSIDIGAGEDITVEVVNSAAPGRLNVIKVAAAEPSVRLEGACFSLEGATTYGPFCDSDDLNDDGRTVFNNVTPGTYRLVETEAPSGYDPAPNREVTINPGVTLQLTIQNEETPPPPEAGTLVVNKVNGDGETLAGGCFRLFDGDTPVTAEICDITDGTNDGRIVFENVPVGTWTLRETLAPSPSYQLAPDREITIENDTTTEVDVPNELKNGRILVEKVTANHKHPVAGACFELDPDLGDPLCSNASGEILFENVPVGTYTLNETTVPYGFEQADPVEGVEVHPGQTTVVTVVNELQPPPNTGSVQVHKFACPVDTADDERTVFLGGAAGNAQLAETKGCAKADAEFTLVGEDGTDGPGAFSTGEDGQYQVTVPAKVYRLDETSPDLPGNSAALLRVEVGRLTTVVVINYVAPPEPEPVNISMAKYTCQAGFSGTTYEDFAASCMSESQLTNNITFRVEGPEDAKAVTGGVGQVGRTAFVDLPSGSYTIYEERPYNIPTNYGFCGWNSDWPADFKTVNGAITADLGEGANLSCTFFNIPENVTDSTGVILVRKYTCDVETPPKGYDHENECRLSDENATFELKQFNEEMQAYGEGTQATANPDGFLRFEDLRPGNYQLREVDSNWCYANSNSVNTNGDVVVRAGQVSLVSIYNCVGPAEPPNTGSGDAANLLSPPEVEGSAPSGIEVTPGIAWPVMIVAVVLALRPRRVLAPGHEWTEPGPERDAA